MEVDIQVQVPVALPLAQEPLVSVGCEVECCKEQDLCASVRNGALVTRRIT
jgi:hypothetical protein